MRQYMIGNRVSFPDNLSKSELCTVRYIGEVDGIQGQWLGVEWDNANRGKHDGSLKGKRYFTCLSPSPTAGSFVRPNRPFDPERSFIEAIYHKYALETTSPLYAEGRDGEIIISGKLAQEVGFDKIREIQAQLHKLKVVILDGMRISMAENENENISEVCPQIVELDLSRNLFQSFKDICQICSKLPNLKKLRLNGNRFSQRVLLCSDPISTGKNEYVFPSVTKLELDEVLMPWESIIALRSYFPNITSLTASSNHLKSISYPLMGKSLTYLALEYNEFETLGSLGPLSELGSLKTLLLKGNKIARINSSDEPSKLVFGVNLEYLDLSYNAVDSWSFVDELPLVFPGITGLRISNNPLYPGLSQNQSSSEIEENFMITLGRIETLKTLNFSNVTTTERRNAEIYYQSKIAQEMSKVPENEVNLVISRHKRFKELCSKWGPPVMSRKNAEAHNTTIIDTRLIAFTFKHVEPKKEAGTIKTIAREIPRSIDVYRVKGLVGKLFGIPGFNLRLIWETGEWDPVAGYEDDQLENSDDEESIHKEIDLLNGEKKISLEEDQGRWKKREVEIESCTRHIGSCIEGAHAIVRVEEMFSLKT
ncbi:Tubulin-specific chaperone E [Golovinomyces cichoracearum]|uniref:Tubulin-specific chaperone E n=1 Tax=Golovinomyces cichoracearum TaxID=62708 RepID=A0A420J380_9PEZI|nr:Tubulin-specific chaperone E [Golovinomyces cichoracearum]